MSTTKRAANPQCNAVASKGALLRAEKRLAAAKRAEASAEGVYERAKARTAKARGALRKGDTLNRTLDGMCRIQKAESNEEEKRRRWSESVQNLRRAVGDLQLARSAVKSASSRDRGLRAQATEQARPSTAKKSSSKKTSTKKTSTKKTSTKKASTKKASTKKTSSKKTAVQGNLFAQDMPLVVWAGEVKKVAARLPKSGRYGSERAFVSSTHKAAVAQGKIPRISLAAFKSKLVEANRRGHLRLHRADLVGAMDPKLVRDSEIKHLNADFHFIETPAPWERGVTS